MKYIFFYRPEDKYGYLSQWYPCQFQEFGMTYCSTEQYMMAQKALLFSDKKTWAKIMASRDPKTIKAIGRQVKNFESTVWDANKYRIVLQGNYLKFSQNQTLNQALRGTGDAILAEASRWDKVWGTGLSEANIPTTQAGDKSWPGKNLLGKALMEVREALING